MSIAFETSREVARVREVRDLLAKNSITTFSDTEVGIYEAHATWQEERYYRKRATGWLPPPSWHGWCFASIRTTSSRVWLAPSLSSP